MRRAGKRSGTSVAQFRLGGERFAVLSVPLTPELPATLTAAERAVVQLVFVGATNAAIARERNVSVRTVANQIASSMKKLKVSSRADLIARLASGSR